jgi:small subunit ribosomal protein S3
MEVQVPELNPKIMCNRIAQLIERGTAFRRACLWTINTISNAGALGAEVTVSGKLRSERAHFEKHSVGVLPKSGDMAEKVVKLGVTHVLTKMGLMGIQLRIALKDQSPQEFEYTDTRSGEGQLVTDKQPESEQKQQEEQEQQQQQPQTEQLQQQQEQQVKRQQRPEIQNSNHTRISGSPAEKQVDQEQPPQQEEEQQPKEQRAVPVGGNPNGQS